MRPNRDHGDHHVSPEEWPWAHFPPFSISDSIVLSTDILPRMLLAASVAPNLAMVPKVYLTGVIPLVLDITTVEIDKFFASGL